MHDLSRRDFIKLGSLLAASFGLSSAFGETFASGLAQLAQGKVKVLWLQAQSCSGCSVSLLNAQSPDIVEVITDVLSLGFHQTVSAATGDTAMAAMRTFEQGDTPFILVIEGSIPLDMPEACVIGGRPFNELVLPLARKAKYIMAVGTCAAFGGIPAAEGNPTGAASMQDFLKKNNLPIDQRLVNCPSCPVHPDTIVGTMAHLASKGYPKVNPDQLTPVLFYSHSTHDDCPRFHYYSKRVFAKDFGDNEGCLFKLGCLGMLSNTECPRRQWNGGVNWCIRAAAPCIGCSHQQFGRLKAFPFYRKGEAVGGMAAPEAERKGGQP
jgi:hydrogenase small subunit